MKGLLFTFYQDPKHVWKREATYIKGSNLVRKFRP